MDEITNTSLNGVGVIQKCSLVKLTDQYTGNTEYKTMVQVKLKVRLLFDYTKLT